MTKKGNPWAIATLEDLEGAIEVHVLPRAYQLVAHPARRGRGASSSAAGSTSARRCRGSSRWRSRCPTSRVGERGPVVITLPAARCMPPVVDRLKERARHPPGRRPRCTCSCRPAGRTTVLRLDDRLRVDREPGAVRRPQGAAGPRLGRLTTLVRPTSPAASDAPIGGEEGRTVGVRARGEASTRCSDDERFGGPTPEGSTPPQALPGAEVLSSSDGLSWPRRASSRTAARPLPEPRSRKRGIAMAAAAVLVLGVGAGAFAVGCRAVRRRGAARVRRPGRRGLLRRGRPRPVRRPEGRRLPLPRKFPQLKDTFTADGGFGPGFAKLFDGSSRRLRQGHRALARQALRGGPRARRHEGPAALRAGRPGDRREGRHREPAGPDQQGRALGRQRRRPRRLRDHRRVVRRGDVRRRRSTRPGAAAQISAEAQAASLESSAAYTSAIAPYGSGVVTVWSDNGGFSKLASTLTAGLRRRCRSDWAARRPPGTRSAVLQLRRRHPRAGRLHHRLDDHAPERRRLGALRPARLDRWPPSAAAGSAARWRTPIAPYLDSLRQPGDARRRVLQQLAPGSSVRTLPGDPFGSSAPRRRWPTLFGDQTVLAVGGGGDEPEVGVHIVGGHKTVAAVRRSSMRAATRASSSRSRTASSSRRATRGSQGWRAGGSFGTSEQFRSAVPDAEHASVVGYVDIAGMVDRFGADLSASDRATLAHLSAVGLSVTTEGDTLSYRVRLLTD